MCSYRKRNKLFRDKVTVRRMRAFMVVNEMDHGGVVAAAPIASASPACLYFTVTWYIRGSASLLHHHQFMSPWIPEEEGVVSLLIIIHSMSW